MFRPNAKHDLEAGFPGLSRKPLMYACQPRPDAEPVNTMLEAAIVTVAATSGRSVVHPDRGGHYRWPGRPSQIADPKLICSMSRKRCASDSAVYEGFFGRLKNELLLDAHW